MSARELRRLGEALGTEAIGIDLAKPLDAETFAWIEDAFAEHPVLVFREQDQSRAQRTRGVRGPFRVRSRGR